MGMDGSIFIYAMPELFWEIIEICAMILFIDPQNGTFTGSGTRISIQ
jgi:hypothetical protein